MMSDAQFKELREKIGSVKIYRHRSTETFRTFSEHKDFEEVMELIHQHTLEARIDEAGLLSKEQDFKYYEYDGADNASLNSQESGEQDVFYYVEDFKKKRIEFLESQKKNASPNQLTDSSVGKNTSSKGDE